MFLEFYFRNPFIFGIIGYIIILWIIYFEEINFQPKKRQSKITEFSGELDG